MARNKPLRVVGFFVKKSGETVPFDSLTEEERLEINKEWIRRWERNLSPYYAAHPEELKALPDATPEQVERYYEMFPEKRT